MKALNLMFIYGGASKATQTTLFILFIYVFKTKLYLNNEIIFIIKQTFTKKTISLYNKGTQQKVKYILRRILFIF